MNLGKKIRLMLAPSLKLNSTDISSNILVSASGTLLIYLTLFTNYLSYCLTNYYPSQTVILLFLSRKLGTF